MVYLLKRRKSQQSEIMINYNEEDGARISPMSAARVRRRLRFEDESENALYQDCYDIIPRTSTKEKEMKVKTVLPILLPDLPPLPTKSQDTPELYHIPIHSPSSIYDTWDLESIPYENYITNKDVEECTIGSDLHVNHGVENTITRIPEMQTSNQVKHSPTFTEYEVWWETNDIYENDSFSQLHDEYENVQCLTQRQITAELKTEETLDTANTSVDTYENTGKI